MNDTIPDARKRLIQIALSFVGVHELGGNNKGPMIEEFQKAVDGKAQGESWCMGFIQYCIKKVEEELNTKALIHRSELCTAVYEKSIIKSTKPNPGSIIIWQKYDEHNKPTIYGHCGIVLSIIDQNWIDVIEGNTNDGTGLVRDGDKVTIRTRARSGGSGNMKIMGYVLPWI